MCIFSRSSSEKLITFVVPRVPQQLDPADHLPHPRRQRGGISRACCSSASRRGSNPRPPRSGNSRSRGTRAPERANTPKAHCEKTSPRTPPGGTPSFAEKGTCRSPVPMCRCISHGIPRASGVAARSTRSRRARRSMSRTTRRRGFHRHEALFVDRSAFRRGENAQINEIGQAVSAEIRVFNGWFLPTTLTSARQTKCPYEQKTRVDICHNAISLNGARAF